MFYVPVGSTTIYGPFETTEELQRHAFDGDESSIMICDTMEEAEEEVSLIMKEIDEGVVQE
ncbi:hypothetical protein D3C86_2134780 [compost metagenome]